MTALVAHGILNGLIVGGVYALIGLSLTILYGALRVLNFAHGQMVITGAFAAYALVKATGLSPIAVAPIVAALFYAGGWAGYYLLIPRLARGDDPETMSFLLTYGLSLAITAALVLVFEADSRSIDFTFEPVSLQIGPVYVATARIVAFGIALLLAAALAWFLFRTLPGKALRAISMNPEAIGLVGLNVAKLSAAAFGLASAIAGVAGVLVAMVFPAFSPFAGDFYSVLGFIIIVLGGLGNPLGAMAAGALYGMVEALSTVFFQQALAQIIGFLLLVGVIAWRSSRFFPGRIAS
jgi:branched-chain amino acid transport system permease protein